jgi:glycosyltransferase involved in cell wall biosynthesis
VRVLCIATAYPRHAGDTVTPWLPALACNLRLAGVEMEILAPSWRGLGRQVIDGVTVHRFRYAPSPLETLTHQQSAAARIAGRPAMLAAVATYLSAGAVAAALRGARGRYDVVHALWPLPHALPGAIAAAAGRAPLVSTFFGSELALARRVRPLRPAVAAAVAVSRTVTTISAYTARLLIEAVPRARPRVIPLGPTVEPASALLPPLHNECVRLLAVGRLVRRKGVHVLLDAMARLVGSGGVFSVPPVLDVVGDGPERPALEAQARALGLSAHVRFHGFVPRTTLSSHYASCDVFVMPSLDDGAADVEGLGIPAIEALSFGRPVVASDAGGIPEVVQDGVTGVLVPPGDSEALARAITGLVSDPSRARDLAAGGRAHVSQRFAWSGVIASLCATYADAARTA